MFRKFLSIICEEVQEYNVILPHPQFPKIQRCSYELTENVSMDRSGVPIKGG
jgi:hypothetical protein